MPNRFLINGDDIYINKSYFSALTASRGDFLNVFHLFLFLFYRRRHMLYVAG